MDDLGSSYKEVDCTTFFFTDLNGRLMNLSVNKHKIQDVFDNDVGFDGCSIAGLANGEHSARILMPHPPTLQTLHLIVKFKISLLRSL